MAVQAAGAAVVAAARVRTIQEALSVLMRTGALKVTHERGNRASYELLAANPDARESACLEARNRAFLEARNRAGQKRENPRVPLVGTAKGNVEGNENLLSKGATTSGFEDRLPPFIAWFYGNDRSNETASDYAAARYLLETANGDLIIAVRQFADTDPFWVSKVRTLTGFAKHWKTLCEQYRHRRKANERPRALATNCAGLTEDALAASNAAIEAEQLADEQAERELLAA